jgi:hypothetical protein
MFYFIILFSKLKKMSALHQKHEVVVIFDDDTFTVCPIKKEKERKESNNNSYCVRVPTKGPTGKGVKRVYLIQKPDSKPLLLHKGPVVCQSCKGCDQKTMDLCFSTSVFRELHSLIRKTKEEEKS